MEIGLIPEINFYGQFTIKGKLEYPEREAETILC
jgi:hypothetical protein